MAYTNSNGQVRIGVRSSVPLVSQVIPPLIVGGLVLNLDAQYYSSGTWSGTSSTTINAGLYSGTQFSNEIGGIMNFDGYDDYILAPYSSLLNFTNGYYDLPFTFMGWFRIPTGGGGTILNKGDEGNSASESYSIYAGLTSIDFTMYAPSSGKSWSSNVSLQPNTWYHYAISYTGGTASSGGYQTSPSQFGQFKIYINGVTQSVSTSGWGAVYRMSTYNLPLYIGSYGTTGQWSNHFKGDIAHQMIYNRTLSDADVNQNYLATKFRFDVSNLLDKFTGSLAAYSLRKLKSIYSGSAIRVRRSSDNSEQDIPFDGSGNLNTSSLLSFVGSGDGFVSVWYDQSGTYNLTQPVRQNQLRIVGSGILDTLNGKPALYKYSNSSWMSVNYGMTYSSPNSYFAVMSFTSSSTTAILTDNSSYQYSPDSDATNFINAAGITDAIQASAINSLVTDLKVVVSGSTQSLWTKMKAVYPFVGGSATSHKFNLKDPRDLDAAYRLVFSGGGVHSSTGYKGGSNAYARTFINAYNVLTNSNLHLSFYSRTADTTNSYSNEIAQDSLWTPNSFITFRTNDKSGGGTVWFSAGNDSVGASTSLIQNGFYIGSEVASNMRKMYRNGSVIATNTTDDTNSLPNAYLNILGNPSSNSYSLNETAFVTIGDGLTDLEASTLYNAVQRFQTALDRQVGTASAYDSDVQSFLNVSGLTSSTQIKAVANLVSDLKEYGIWSKMKAIYPFVGGSANTNKWNLKDINNYNLSFVGSGWTHNSNGSISNGSTGTYINMNIPINQIFTSTNGLFGIYTTQSTSSGSMFGVTNNSNSDWSMSYSSGALYFNMYGTSNTLAYTSLPGLSCIGMEINGLRSIYKNGLRIANYNGFVAMPQNLMAYVSARNVNGTSADAFSAGSYNLVFFSNTLTQTEHKLLYNAIQTFQTNLNRWTGNPNFGRFSSFWSNNELGIGGNDTLKVPHTPSLSNQNLYHFTTNGTTTRFNINNKVGAYGDGVYSPMMGLIFNGLNSQYQPSQSKWQEILVYDREQDFNRTKISNNINSYYSTYTDTSADDLILSYNVNNSVSYSGTGSTIYDISSNTNNGILL